MLCRYERTIFKSDKGFCIFSYSTEDQSVPKEARNRSFYHDDKSTSLQSAIISWLPMQWR